jgi:hypothetical protein
VVADRSVSPQCIASIVGRDQPYHVCGGAYASRDAPQTTGTLPQSDEGIP